MNTGLLYRILKRLFDIAASAVAIVLLLPVWLFAAVGILLSDPGPIFYLARRAGKDNRIFRMFKFRTMTDNHGGSSVSVAGESRITPLGAKLRKYKLDELPELWNVLIGDMSFVGPRPDVPGYADQLQGDDREVLQLRPGITGPATLKYRNEEELLATVDNPQEYNDNVIFPDKVRINRYYLHHYSFGMDLKMILATVLGRHILYNGEII